MRKFLLLFGLFCFSSLGVSANNLDAIKNEKGDDQFLPSYCYEIKIQKEIFQNWIRVGPISSTTHNKFTTETGASEWYNEIYDMYDNSSFDTSTGTGILYTLPILPTKVSLSKCEIIINP